MKLKITQIKSTIGCNQTQIDTIKALGLRKIRHTKIHEDNSTIRGMVYRVRHLVSVEEIND